MKKIVFNNQSFDLHDVFEYEIEECKKYLKHKDKYTKKDIEVAISKLRQENEINIKNKEYIKYLKETSYLMHYDILDNIDKNKKDELINKRKEALDFLNKNGGF